MNIFNKLFKKRKLNPFKTCKRLVSYVRARESMSDRELAEELVSFTQHKIKIIDMIDLVQPIRYEFKNISILTTEQAE